MPQARFDPVDDGQETASEIYTHLLKYDKFIDLERDEKDSFSFLLYILDWLNERLLPLIRPPDQGTNISCSRLEKAASW